MESLNNLFDRKWNDRTILVTSSTRGWLYLHTISLCYTVGLTISCLLTLHLSWWSPQYTNMPVSCLFTQVLFTIWSLEASKNLGILPTDIASIINLFFSFFLEIKLQTKLGQTNTQTCSWAYFSQAKKDACVNKQLMVYTTIQRGLGQHIWQDQNYEKLCKTENRSNWGLYYV